MMNRLSRLSAAALCLVGTALGARAEETLFDRAPWSVSFGLAGINFEGDEVLEDGVGLYGRLAYSFNPRWDWEGKLDLYPGLDGAEGENPTRIRLGGNRGKKPAVADTMALRLGTDAIFHLRNVENLRFDPFLSAGVGFMAFEEEVDGDKTRGHIQAGGGLMYHWGDAWALRADIQPILAGTDTEANLLYALGVNYRIGTGVPSTYTLTGNTDLDSDQDGIPDSLERKIGTDPNDKDTDDDGLTDGEEYFAKYGYKTDPLNPDTDGDGLKDGEEIKKYKTNPLDPDTDKDGLKDGEEVHTYKTDPLNPDTDGDGLKDGQEVHGRFGASQKPTDPLNPDTDGDELNDGDEVLKFKTDPHNPDTDGDWLKDGAEVHKHSTDPLDRDTDDGGVDDGHEVIEDFTDPRPGHGADDLIKRDIKVEFDYDKATIRSIDTTDLDFVTKILQRDPGATAVIEGHADKRPTSKRDYNQKLSERRAQSVVAYINQKGGITTSRMKAKGFGFDRPVAPNDTEANMQKNRRVEVYIRRSREGGIVNPQTPTVVP